MEGRKEGKDEEIKGGYLASWCTRRKEEWRGEVPMKVRTKCNLEELCEWEQAKEKRKINRVRENCKRYTVRKRAVSEQKKRVFSLLKLYL